MEQKSTAEGELIDGTEKTHDNEEREVKQSNGYLDRKPGADENQNEHQNEIVVSDDNQQNKENEIDSSHETGLKLNTLESKQGKQGNKEDNVVSEVPTSTDITLEIKTLTPKKAKKRGIFVSYSPDASYEEKRFICYTVKELKNLGFSDDIWFDKDEGVTGNPSCSQQRLEIVEKCRAALVFLSTSYLNCKLCKRESTVLFSRNEESNTLDSPDEHPKPVRLFCINYDIINVPSNFCKLEGIVYLNSEFLAFASVAEKSSAVVGAFSEELEKYALLFGANLTALSEHEGNFKGKKVYSWDVDDVQEWLASMQVHQRFGFSFEENQIDGFLLLSLTDSDLENHLMVESKVVRRKLLQHFKSILEKENLEKGRWYMKLRKVKTKSESVYIIYDPTDMKFKERLRKELAKKNIQVFCHERLGQSKEEFLQLNGGQLAAASQVLLVMSSESANSLFVYNELMFADWLDKPCIVSMVKNSWRKMRLNMQALLGSCPAVDFETKPFHQSLDVLLYHVKPFRNMPAVILEQEFIDRMVDGIKPLRVLVNNTNYGSSEVPIPSSNPKIFLSYHWDVQSKVERLVQYLESQGFDCWTDVNTVSKRPSSIAIGNDNLQSQIQRKMKSSNVVLSCVTQKYVCSENCSNDLSLADSLAKPVVPLMFQWMSWPPEGVAIKARKILAPLQYIDLSNEKLLKKNLHSVVLQLNKHLTVSSPRESKR